MAAYINPPKQSKEDWLKENAKSVTVEEAKKHSNYNDNLLVALADNGPFTAAGIAFDEREKKEWLYELEYEHRRITFYTASKTKLLEVSNLQTYL